MAKTLRLCKSCNKELIIDDKNDMNARVTCIHCNFKGIISQFPKAQLKKVVCPKCRTVLSFSLQKTGAVICSSCKHNADISTFLPERKRISDDDVKLKTDVVGQQSSPSRLRRQAALELTEGDCSPKKIEFIIGINTIGRSGASSKCLIQLDTKDEKISRNHAQIELSYRQDETFEYYISDLGSTNGTFVNERKIEPPDTQILCLDDKIRMGRTIFRFTQD